MNLTQQFKKLKREGKKWTVVTSYDYWSANILNHTEVDALLVGDCAAMVMHGHPNTLLADVEMLCTHTLAVSKGAPDKFIITALPFMTGRKSLRKGIKSVEEIIKAGAHAIKIEGGYSNEVFIKQIIDSGIPVIGHTGLKPTHINHLQGFRVQGKTEEDFDLIVNEARLLEDLGCTAVVLEAVPPSLGQAVSETLNIPVIGIGAGPFVDGQGLVFQDLLGLTTDFKPKFVRQYADGAKIVSTCVNNFVSDVIAARYPMEHEMYLPKPNKKASPEKRMPRIKIA